MRPVDQYVPSSILRGIAALPQDAEEELMHLILGPGQWEAVNGDGPPDPAAAVPTLGRI
ncbi:MAG: hypothetical protein QXN33_00215 [Candidatus Bathyarchaeia archaeon]